MRQAASGKCCLAGTVQAAHPLQLLTRLLTSCKQMALLITESPQQQQQQCQLMLGDPLFRKQRHHQNG
jgi:hypothetical protein